MHRLAPVAGYPVYGTRSTFFSVCLAPVTCFSFEFWLFRCVYFDFMPHLRKKIYAKHSCHFDFMIYTKRNDTQCRPRGLLGVQKGGSEKTLANSGPRVHKLANCKARCHFETIKISNIFGDTWPVVCLVCREETPVKRLKWHAHRGFPTEWGVTLRFSNQNCFSFIR